MDGFEILSCVVHFVQTVAWQIVALVAIILFRRELRGLLDRLKKWKFPWGEGDFGDRGEDTKPAKREFVESQVTGEWQKPGDLFWLGADFEWTLRFIMLGAAKNHIVRGLDQVHLHVQALNLGEKRFENSVRRLRDTVSNALESDLTQDRRRELFRDLNGLKGEVGDYIVAKQRGFSSSP